MSKLTPAQTQILIDAAATKDGATTAPDATKATIIGLVRRELIVSEPQDGGPTRLVITEAGRAAIAADAEPLPDSAADDAPATSPEPPPKAETKVQRVVALLRRTNGASVEELMSETGWQAHSVRGALSGAIKKGLGLNVVSEKTDGGRRYRIPVGEALA